MKKKHEVAEGELNVVRMKMKECDSQISNIVKEQQKLQATINEASLEKKKLENEVTGNLPNEFLVGFLETSKCSFWGVGVNLCVR